MRRRGSRSCLHACTTDSKRRCGLLGERLDLVSRRGGDVDTFHVGVGGEELVPRVVDLALDLWWWCGGGPGFTTRNFTSRDAAALASSRSFSSKMGRRRPATFSKSYSLGSLLNFWSTSTSVATNNCSACTLALPVPLGVWSQVLAGRDPAAISTLHLVPSTLKTDRDTTTCSRRLVIEGNRLDNAAVQAG
jgi:hypothetical protein